MRIAVGLGKKGGEERLAQQGVSRRDFLKFCTAVAVTMGLGPSMATEVAAALTNRRASVVYLHCAECTGCSEALLRTCKPFLDTLILDTISLDYHETIMAAAGEAAEAALEQAISNPEGFICVVEGAIPTAMDGKYGYVGGHTMLDLCKRVLPKAKAVVTMGTCAAYGGVQNPISHTRGTVSMARSMMPDSASSQFFICHQDAPHLNGDYAAFGHVTEGMDVVDAVCAYGASVVIDGNGTVPAEKQPVIVSVKVID